MKKTSILIAVVSTFIVGMTRAQEVYYGESFELNSPLTPNQSIEYKANDFIHLKKGFQSLPQSPNYAMMEIDPYFNPETPYGITFGQPNDCSIKGRLGFYPLSFDVNENGAAVISMPLEFPEGINGMTPHLSLNYNSQGGNGILGLGWSLGGMSKISRVPYSYMYDDDCHAVQFSNVDELSLDGVILRKGSRNGVPCYYPEIYDYSIVYPINSNGSIDDGFRVLKRDGNVYTYDVKYCLPQINTPIEWHLSRVEDPFGNYIEYRYVNVQNEGAFYPEEICYTGHAGLSPKYKIIFEYYPDDDRNDCPPKYFSQPNSQNNSNINSGHSRITKRLFCINCWYESHKIMSYKLDYKTLDWDIRALSFVEKQFFDNDGKWAYNKLIPTEFKWKETNYQLQYETAADEISLDMDYNSTYQWFQYTAFAARFERDNIIGRPKYEQDIVHLMQKQEGYPPCYHLSVFHSDNMITENQQLYHYDDTGFQYDCSSLNDAPYGSFMDGRKILAFLPADTDGDGFNEIMCASYYHFENRVKITLIKPTDEGVFFESSAIKTYSCPNNITDFSDFTIADFNGDGLSDLFFMFTQQPFVLISSQNAPFSTTAFYNYNYGSQLYRRIVIGDFNGDKKDQILIVAKHTTNGSPFAHFYQILETTNGLQFSGQQSITDSIPANYFNSNNCYRLCAGDFNGDGKTDIVLLCHDKWRFYFSKGNGVFRDVITNDEFTTDSYVMTYENQTDDLAYVFVSDLDQDGCDDISIVKVNLMYSATYIGAFRRDFLIRPTKDIVKVRKIRKLKSQSDTDVCIDSLARNGDYYATFNSFVAILGNHKGTAPNEVMTCRMGHRSGFNNVGVSLHNTGCLDNPPVRAIDTIVTSLGAKTMIGYRPVSYQFVQNDTYGREDYDLSDGNRDLTPVLPYNGYMNIVENVMTEMNDNTATAPNSSKTFRKTRYHFSRPYYHTRGRGFLGFNWVWSRQQGQNHLDDIISTQYYSLNDTYSIMVPESRLSKHFNSSSSHNLDTYLETEFTYDFQTYTNFHANLGQIPNDVFSPYLKEAVTKTNDGHIMFEKEEFEKDGFGNVTKHEHYYGINEFSYPFYEIKDMTFENQVESNRWILGVPKTDTLTQLLCEVDDNMVIRNTSYQNNMNTGLHTQKCTEPGNEKQLIETYTYDDFGNLISTTATGSGITRTESVIYFDDGRFPKATINALGHTTTYTYDDATGRMKSVTDPNGLTTSYHYDILGNLIQTEYPSGVLEDQTMMWVDNRTNETTYHPDTPDFGCPIYFTYSKRSGERESYVFYDQHNRKLREVSCNMEGEKIYTDYRYYSISGLLESESAPYFKGLNETPQYTHYSYDYLGRNIEIERPDGGIMHHYYANGKEDVLGFDGQHTEFTFNPMGFVQKSKSFGGVSNTEVNFAYYGDGKLWVSFCNNNNMTNITYTYDINRNPLTVTDPSLGELTYNYNAFGELVGSTTPNDETSYTYDALGRMTQRSGSDGNSYWTYDNGFIGALASTNYTPTSGPTVKEGFLYDQYGHLIQQTQKVGEEEEWTFNYTYNSLGKQSSITYPSGKKVKYHYNGKGFMDYVKDAATGEVLWQANASDRWDNISSFTEGNIDVEYSYDPVTGLVNSIGATRNNQILLNQEYHWTTTGNLDWRTDATLDLKESFGYDGFNRLTSAIAEKPSTNENYFSQSFNYDSYGNITGKTGVGSYSYGTNASPYAVTGLQPETGQEALFTHQEATYTSFDKLSTISQDGKTLSVNYGIDRQRVMQTFSNGTTTRTKRYFTPLYETVTENGVTKKLHYLTSSTGLFAIFASYNNGGGTMHYTLKDHQGNLTATVCGSTVERLSYDAWGRRRNPVGFGYSNVPHTFDRGYTLHEHYDDFDLINMNGRLYDPVLGRMLSPDIAIQDEYNAQAYNRYSYCFNNPLRFTDPSGYFVRGSRNYYDWNSMVYYGFGNYRNNGSAFNTDLSEGKLSPVYDIDGVLLGTTKEGFTGQVLVYEGLEDIDFSSMTEQEALLYEGVDSYDNIRNSLSEEARSNIWTNIVSHFEGLRVYDEKFSLASITDNRIGFGGEGAWNTYMKSGHIKGSDLYKYETTVENIASSIIVHEWYSHLMKRNGNKMRSHRLAYKNVINYKPLWNETTDAYKGFVVRQLFKYTKGETGRTKVDPLYRYSYYKYKDY